MDRVLLCRVGWMRDYRGTLTDPIQNGGAFVTEHRWGFEAYNFLPFEGRYFGFVEPPGGGRSVDDTHENKQIRIEKIGASPGDTQVDDVLVIWFAKKPSNPSVGSRVVGWYEGASVFRRRQPPPNPEARTATTRTGATLTASYHMSAPVDSSRCLPPAERDIQVPFGEGGAGMSNIWYGDTDAGRNIVEAVRRRITARA